MCLGTMQAGELKPWLLCIGLKIAARCNALATIQSSVCDFKIVQNALLNMTGTLSPSDARSREVCGGGVEAVLGDSGLTG